MFLWAVTEMDFFWGISGEHRHTGVLPSLHDSLFHRKVKIIGFTFSFCLLQSPAPTPYHMSLNESFNNESPGCIQSTLNSAQWIGGEWDRMAPFRNPVLYSSKYE